MAYAKTKKQKRSDRQLPKTTKSREQRDRMGMALWTRALQHASQRQSMQSQWQQWQKLYAGMTVLSSRGQGGSSEYEDDGFDISVNIVRTKVDVMSAWIQNLLFPSGDKPWKINPTPVPQLVYAAKYGTEQLVSPQVRVPSVPGSISPQMQQAGNNARIQMEHARRAAEQMERVIQDSLVQCDYERQARMMLDQSCRLGTGVMKGPVGRTSDYRRAIEPKWFFDPQTGQPYESVLAATQNADVPSALWVDLWNVYPDMRARDFRDCEFVYEKHIITRNHLLKLAQIPGYDKRAIVRAARHAGGSDEHTNAREQQVHHMQGSRNMQNMHVMWQYHGPIMFQEYSSISQYLMDSMDEGDTQVKDGMEQDREIEREMGLAHTNVVIRVVDGEIISMARSDFSASEIYHAYTPIPTTGLFGRGLPDVLGKLQKILNSLYRDVVCGSKLANTAFIAIRQGVDRADGSNSWDHVQVFSVPEETESTSQTPAFQVATTSSQTKDTLQAFHITRQMIDDVSGIPLISQGDQASHITKTASGLGLLNDNAQTTARRMVRMMDDQVIKSIIRSFYKWHMLYGENRDAKGDFAVEARGSSVHYSRQIQGELLPVFWQTYAADPDARTMLKIKQVVKQHAAVLNLPADLIIKTDEEMQADAKAMSQQVDPEMEKDAEELAIKREKVAMDYDAKIKKLEADKAIALAQVEHLDRKLRSQERRDAAQIGREQRAAKREAQALSDGGEE